jgi:hypothetical protein
MNSDGSESTVQTTDSWMATARIANEAAAAQA